MDDPSISKEVIFYHGAFVHYIAPAAGPLQPQDPARKSASLSRLACFTESHLTELCADMHDELIRRNKPGSKNYLVAREDIHWKRNDARKHVASLPIERFKEICRDLVTELERRHPELKTGPTYPLQDAMPMANRAKSSQRNTSESSQRNTSESSRRNTSEGKTLSDGSRGVSVDSSKTNQSLLSSGSTTFNPSLQIQSVSKSSIVPTKVLLVESDSEDEDNVTDVVQHYSEMDDKAESSLKNLNDKKAVLPVLSPIEIKENSNSRAISGEVASSRSLEGSLGNAEPVNSGRVGDHLTNAVDSSSKHEFDGTKDLIKSCGSSDETTISKSIPNVTTNTSDNQKNILTSQDQSEHQKGQVINSLSTTDSNERHDNPSQSASLGHESKSNIANNATNVEKDSINSKELTTSGIPTRDLPIIASEVSSDSNENALRREIQELREALGSQKAVTERVREEAAQFLEEMKSLTEHHEKQIMKAETSDAELDRWKQRHEKLSKELEKTRKNRIESAISQPRIGHPLPAEYLSAHGTVSFQVIENFLNSVSALVAAVHSSNNTLHSQDLLDLLHHIIVNARQISREDQLISRCANQLISVLRNFTVSRGLFPMILVDSACSDLSMSVLEYTKNAKIKNENNIPSESKAQSGAALSSVAPTMLSVSRSPEDKANSPANVSLEEKPLERLQNAQSGSPKSSLVSQSSSPNSSTASAPRIVSGSGGALLSPSLSPNASKDSSIETLQNASLSSQSSSASPSPRFRPYQGPQMPLDESVKELQVYLEGNTSDSIDAIGAILGGIKSNSTAGELKPLIDSIQRLASGMVDRTSETIKETRSRVLKDRGTFIVRNLKDCLARMNMLKNDELDAIRDDAKLNRHLKQRLAGVNFDMAKSIKELVKSVEEVVLQEEVDNIDRKLA